jgi:serine/threonine-protein kinase
MSEVYRARPDDDGPDVAVKLVRIEPDNPDNAVILKRFEREASIIADLDHPNIVRFLDHGSSEDYIYVVMPLIQGGTLVDVIRAGVAQPPAVCHWLGQLASALDHAHKLDVIHRDLKPGNILLDEDGNAYLTDFGIALLTTHTSNLTQTGIVLGTPAYMSPEQWRDDPLDGRADVYGLAVVVYLLLTRHTPFEAETSHAMMYSHLSEPPPSPLHFRPELPQALEGVFKQALAKERQERYPSAGAFAQAFITAVEGATLPNAPALSSAPTPAHNPSAPPAIERPYYPIPDYLHQDLAQQSAQRWRRMLWAVGGGIVVLALLAGLLSALNLTQNDSNDSTPSQVSPSPTVLTTPNTRPANPPRVLIESPQNGTSFSIGQEVVILVRAFDRDKDGGITHIEVRRFGEVLDTFTVDASIPNPKEFVANLRFVAQTPGQLRLEVLPYRGPLAGDPDILEIVVN